MKYEAVGNLALTTKKIKRLQDFEVINSFLIE